MICAYLCVFVLILSNSYADFAPGEYIPRSYYIIDHFGHQSDPVFFRNKREISNNMPFSRTQRGAPNYGDYADPANIMGQVQQFLSNIPGNVEAFSGRGGLGQPAYQGPILFSRMGETQGKGVHVSGHAEGPNAAYSSSSSSVDSNGKIKYSVQSGKY